MPSNYLISCELLCTVASLSIFANCCLPQKYPDTPQWIYCRDGREAQVWIPKGKQPSKTKYILLEFYNSCSLPSPVQAL